MGRRAAILELDVRDYSAYRRIASGARSAFGKIDVLVNNAGCNVRKPAAEITWEDWNLVLETNLRGTFFVSQAIAPFMVEARYGRIVTMALRPARGTRGWRRAGREPGRCTST